MRRSPVLTAIAGGLICMAPSSAAFAPPDRSSLVIGDTAIAYEVDGIKVIHQPRPPTSNIVAVELHLLGGSRQITADNAGIEPFLLLASEYGSKNYPGEAARRALALTGGSIGVDAAPDWTTYGFYGMKQEFDSTWAVFTDRLMHPTLDSVAIRLVRTRMLTAAARRIASPQGHIWFLAESLAYREHPYFAHPDGNAKSLQAIAAADLRNYSRDQLVKSRMLLVVVGDIPRQKVEESITRTLGNLPRGNYAWTLAPPPKTLKPVLLQVDRTMATNYILGYINGPPRSSKEYPAFQRAMMLLSGFINYEVRERNALSYAAYVDVQDRGAPAAAIFMSTTRPDSAMRVVNRVLERIERDITIPRFALRKAAESFNTRYVYGTESAATHAEMLAEAQLYEGDYRAAASRAEVMAKIAFGELRAAIRSYVKNIQYVYLGDTTLVKAAEFKKR